jgi:hypothetical protein
LSHLLMTAQVVDLPSFLYATHGSWILCYLFMTLRLESSFRSFSRPVLHAAARVVQEMGKSRAAAFALGAYDEGAPLDVESLDSDLENPMAEGMMLL